MCLEITMKNCKAYAKATAQNAATTKKMTDALIVK